MDDHTNLRVAHNFWIHPSLSALWSAIKGDTDIGRFQPLYKVWILCAYQAGAKHPVVIYFLTTLAGLLLLPVWGLILDKVFNGGRRSPFWIWVYPLAFFIFAPFWNAFMYVSIQEKFLYFFGAPAIYFFLRTYEKNAPGNLAWVLLFTLLAIMSKETGIVFFLAFAAYAFCDAVFFRRRPRLSLIIWAASTVFSILYYIGIKHLLRNYTARYADSLGLATIIQRFHTSPFYIKAAALLALFMLIVQIVSRLRDRQFQENGQTLFAWLTGFYILILLPWGFPTYILPPLAVFFIASATGIFQAGDRWTTLRYVKRALLTALAFLTALFFILPQIEKMADKHKLVEAVRQLHAANPTAAFFYPAPYSETATSIQIFSGAPVTYLINGSLTPDRLAVSATGYLLINDECWPAGLRGISPAATVYSSSTWKIYSLKTEPGYQADFKEYPKRNPLQRLTALIKKL
ncbi:MAG: hypothetical protein HGA80_08560 [Candidatus Omnitrophica bacterium]|nr:hypothetical protein [Candidatus Omnitrophota bacterium]